MCINFDTSVKVILLVGNAFKEIIKYRGSRSYREFFRKAKFKCMLYYPLGYLIHSSHKGQISKKIQTVKKIVMKVLKFGGSSVGSSENINQVIDILSARAKSEQLIVVVSAVGGITDKLLAAAQFAVNRDLKYREKWEEIKEQHLKISNEIAPDHKPLKQGVEDLLTDLKKLLDGIYLINELSPATTDKLLSFGERLSSLIISETLKLRGINSRLKLSDELIITDDTYTRAEVIFEKTNKNLVDYFSDNSFAITLMPGFISRSEDGIQTTLGRGGSDYTAAIVAAALEVDLLEIWTDVSGMYTANPKLVKHAYPIKELSYMEAVELSHFGAKVLYPPTVQPVMNKSISILIKNTLKPEDEGTLITRNPGQDNGRIVKGISYIENIALLTLEGNGMVGIPGISKRLFETLANEKISLIMITQASSEHSICIGIDAELADKAKKMIDTTFENEIALKKISPIHLEKELSIIAIVGDKMKNRQGISGRMFSTLGKNNVNIRAIAQGASELNISAVVAKRDVKKALNSLHERFFQPKTKQLNLFIMGVGNVGSRLIEQIEQQRSFLKKNHKLNLRIIALSNSRQMLFDEGGIDLKTWKDDLQNGEKADIDQFQKKAIEINYRNSVFVDITANDDIAGIYSGFLQENIAVVACNKVACSGSYDNYIKLKELSRNYSTPFLFETNVGAGLPVIDTLNHLINSGDEITSIHAVLSGSLNFIFNHFNSETKFHDVVLQAKTDGYTEPDPRIDLSGVDVARKILILGRESGFKLDLEDIEIDGFLTDKAMNAESVNKFFESLKEDESNYQSIYQRANNNNCRLKFVAEFTKSGAKVGLKEIPKQHPFYDLEGKDNIVMFFTKRYCEQPMIIKGAGAGAEVTASGLFADIIRIAKN